ncbi:hypothetical protein V8F20_000005 [Naviculisporaceae sp. PSN 640]
MTDCHHLTAYLKPTTKDPKWPSFIALEFVTADGTHESLQIPIKYKEAMHQFQFLPETGTGDTPPVPASTSRQKSCNACVRGKRKCDRRAPVCSRCAERAEPCVYKRRRLAASPGIQAEVECEVPDPLEESEKGGRTGKSEQAADPTSAVVGSMNHENNSAAALSPTSFLFSGLSPFDFDFLEFSDIQPPGGTDLLPAHITTGSNLGTRDDVDVTVITAPSPKDRFLNAASSNDLMWLSHGQPGIEIDRRGTPVGEKIQATYEKMGELCTPFEPWTLYGPTTRTSYLYNRIKAFPSDFATHNASPFLHRHLYKENYVPPCILACFSTSVMYTNRTEASMGMVLRALQQDLDKLLAANSSSEIVTTPYEKLARVHALFMYQVIRLFDGDVALRAQGERDMQILERWVLELCRIGDNLGGHDRDREDGVGSLPTSRNGDVAGGDDAVKISAWGRHMTRPVSWERWIFAESVRRTIFMVYSVIGMYQLMKRAPLGPGGPDDPGPWKYIYRWTLSAPLWEAESSFDFYRAWEDKGPHFVIDNYDLEDFLRYGRPDQVDEFGKIILTAKIGQDATKEFLAGNVCLLRFKC